MKKTIRLKESELKEIMKKILIESETDPRIEIDNPVIPKKEPTKKLIRIKESELKEMIERMLNEYQFTSQTEIDEPTVEPMEPETDPGIETDRPFTPEKERENVPGRDPFTPIRRPSQDPQPRAIRRNGR